MPSPGQLLALLTATWVRRREQWLSPAKLSQLRGFRLRRLARAAVKTAHFGRLFSEAGLEPDFLAREQELLRLPVLEKATLHAPEENGLLVPGAGRLFPVMTSGSTGQPVRVYRSMKDQAEVSALWARVLNAYGHGFFDSQVNISSGRAVAREGPVALLRRLNLLPEIRQLSSFEPLDRQIEVLRDQQPHTFSAYAVSLEAIADAVLERGIRDVRPSVVFSSAMPLSDRGRLMAERAFGVAPLDVYVTSELGTLGWECPVERGTLHLNDDMQIVEILDDRDRPVPDGETGQVVVTQLGCLAQPLLRYRVGDLAARVPGRCACGRGLARLSPVHGRTRHVIHSPDGRVLYGIMLSRVIGPFHEVRRWQLRQTAADTLRLLVVPSPAWRPEVVVEIERQLAANFGPALRFEVEAVDDLPLAPTGKFQTVVPLPDIPGPPAAPTS